MPLSHILAGLLITLLWIGRYVLNKEAGVKKCAPVDLSFSNSAWMALGAIVITVMFWNTEFVPFFASGQEMAFPLFMSVIKGFALYSIVRCFAQISGKSLSSGTFTSNTNFLIGSILIMLIFGDNLNLWDVLSVIAIGAVGILFLVKGHGRVLNKSDKIAYFIIILGNTVCMISDRIVAVNYSWAVQLSVSSLTWFGIGVFSRLIGKSKKHKNSFSILKNKTLLTLGVVYLGGEIFLMYFIQNVFAGVITPAVFMLAATPATMLISALKYHEDKWHEQLIFSALIIAPVLTFIIF